jgi:TldD protein
MNHRQRSCVIVLVCLSAVTGGAQVRRDPPSPLLGILRAELRRNLDGLKTEPVPPYYIAYSVHDVRRATATASFGALMSSGQNRNRAASVDVRVGDYALDNTHPLRGDGAFQPSRITRVPIALTDEEMPIRMSLWRSTDRAFRQAVETLARAKTNVASKVVEENPAPDFSREEPEVHSSAAPPLAAGAAVLAGLDIKPWEDRLRRLTAPFAEDPLMLRGEAQLAVEAVTRTYVSNEGAEIQDTQIAWRLFVQSMTKAEDGMELPLYISYYSRTAEGLPPERQMLADVRDMLAMSARLRTAPMVDPYSGPAILSGRAAGVFFHEIFGHRVEGHRQRNADDAQTFAGRVGQPVLPAFLSVVFDPTQAKLGTTELAGHYLYDDEGVKAQRVTVVDKGVLKTFLLSRRPLKGFPVSNGHGRGQTGQAPVSRQSNLLVESTEIVPHEKLIGMLKDEARRQGKTYGLLFDNIQGGFTFTGRDVPNAFTVQPLVVYRIHTDDRPAELVRGVDLIGTPLAAFGKIAATSDQRGVFNGMCGAESGSVPVAAASPALLVTEVEVQKKSRSQETRPILPAPAKKD